MDLPPQHPHPVLQILGDLAAKDLQRTGCDGADGVRSACVVCTSMATYVLIPGAGSDWGTGTSSPPSSLEALGHDVVAVDLPCDDDSAGLADDAGRGGRSRDRDEVDPRRRVARRVHGATRRPPPGRALRPRRGHGAATGPVTRRLVGQHRTNFPSVRPEVMFTHDLAPDLAVEHRSTTSASSRAPLEKPWPLSAWPDAAHPVPAVSRRPLLPRRLPAARGR